MWFATSDGVSIYDGRSFERVDKDRGLGAGHVNCLAFGAQGSAWLGQQDGLFHFDRSGRLARVSAGTNSTGKRSYVTSLAAAADGAVWAGTLEGAIRCAGGSNLTLNVENGLPGNQVYALQSLPDGSLWAGTDNGPARWREGRVETLTLDQDFPVGSVFSIALARDGSLWLATTAGLCRYADGRVTRFTQRDGLAADEVVHVHCRADGTIWIAYPQRTGPDRQLEPGLGVTRFDGRSFVHFTTADGLVENQVNGIAEDPAGGLWFGTLGGVSRFDPETMQTFTTADGLAANQVTALAQAADGSVWAGHGTPLLSSSPPRGASRGGTVGSSQQTRAFAALGLTNGLPGLNVQAICRAPDGTLHLATDRGLARWDGKSFLEEPAGESLDLTEITTDASSNLWVRARLGAVICVRPDGTWTNYPAPAQVLRMEKGGVGFGLASEPNGDVWTGFHGGGLGRLDPRGQYFAFYTATNGLPDAFVNRLFRDTNSALWIASAFNGLARFDGHQFVTFNRTNGLADNLAYAAMRDRDGLLWVGTAGGVSLYDGWNWSTLDRRDGLPGNEVHALTQTADGALWLGTDKGLARLVRSRRTPPPPAVAVRAESLHTTDDGVRRLFTGTRVTLEFSSQDFTTRPASRLYRLLVAPGDLAPAALTRALWRPASHATQAEWTTDTPGRYTLAVQYVDRDLNYSPPTRLLLEIVRPWYANAFIVVPSGAAVVGQA